MGSGHSPTPDVDIVKEIQDLLPEGYDWRRTVRRYPYGMLGLGIGVGLFLGSRPSRAIISALAGSLTTLLVKNINEIFQEE